MPVRGPAVPTQTAAVRLALPLAHLALQVDALAGDSTVARRALVRLDSVIALRPDGFELSDALPVLVPEEALGAELDDRAVRQLGRLAHAGGPLPRRAPLAVYVEVYGLTVRDGRARYTLAVRADHERPRGGLAGLLGRRDGARTASTVEATAPGPDDRQLVALDLSALPPDADRVVVTLAVRDEATGEVRERRLTFGLVPLATAARATGGAADGL